MSGIIVYYSTYGSTHEYAEALGEKMGWTVLSYRKVKAANIQSVDIVVLASNVRIEKLGISKWAKRYKKHLTNKKVVVLAVGANPFENQAYYLETTMKSIYFLNLKKENIFGLGGRIKTSDLHGMDAFIFKVLGKMIKDDKIKKDFFNDVNHFDIDHLNGIINYLSALK